MLGDVRNITVNEQALKCIHWCKNNHKGQQVTSTWQRCCVSSGRGKPLMIVVLGTYPGRLSKLTMKLSIIAMEVEDEGECVCVGRWGAKAAQTEKNSKSTSQKCRLGEDNKYLIEKKRKRKKKRKERKKKENICQVSISFLVVCFL